MQNQQQGMQFQGSSQMPAQISHGGHEIFDVDEAIGGLIGAMEQYTLYEQHVQDPNLKTLLTKQKSYMTQLYNSVVEAFKTGQEPTVKAQTYNFAQNSNNTIYGMKPPSQPKTPAQSVNEINDECISNFMMGCIKANATAFTTAALEATNPVTRRVLQDSIPNIIEMGYELFLYQNRNQYYQVPQLKQEDMQNYLNSYAPVQNNMTH